MIIVNPFNRKKGVRLSAQGEEGPGVQQVIFPRTAAFMRQAPRNSRTLSAEAGVPERRARSQPPRGPAK